MTSAAVHSMYLSLKWATAVSYTHLMIKNGLFLLSISSYMQDILVGIIVLVVLSINAITENRNIELNRK